MKISQIGGEFALINRVTRKVKNKDVIVGIGDDTAVLKYKANKYLLFTTDMLVENDHFNLKWSAPEQIGRKSIEVNVSDIAAMGGKPTHTIISLCLRKDTPVEFVDRLYEGIYDSAKKYKLEIIGGDTTHGSLIVINIAMLGEVNKNRLCLRSNARINDLICVTGSLGDSTAGLNLLLNNIKDKNYEKIIKKHLEPEAQLNKSKIISKYCNTMIDVSDGLASEARHICEMSKVGAVIYKEKIPISALTKKAAKSVNKDAYGFALYGGEDFELVFTVPVKNISIMRTLMPELRVVGKILHKNSGIFLLDKNRKIKLEEGYDHFK